MNRITEYYPYAELAFAAYANLLPGVNPIPVLRDAAVGMSSTQAAHFADRWRVIDVVNDSMGLSATLFQEMGTDGTLGRMVLAIRGTEVSWPNVIADFMADGGIILHGRPDFSVQYQVLKARVNTWQQSGVLNGSFSVTGHSLGGWLATGLVSDFGAQIEHAYLYNTPGVGGSSTVRDLLLSALGIPAWSGDPAKISNLRAAAGGSLIAGLGLAVSSPIPVEIEDQLNNPERPASYNHSQRVLTDALAVYALYADFAPSLSMAQIGMLVRSSSNSPLGTLESALDALRTSLGFAMSTETEDRDALYGNLYDLQAKLGYQSLKGTVNVRLLATESADSIAAKAKADFGYFFALQKVLPFAIEGGAAAQDADAQLFARWNQDKVARASGDALNFTDAYLGDRAAYLGWLLQTNLDDDLPRALSSAGVTENWQMQDRGVGPENNIELTALWRSKATTPQRLLVFGTEGGDADLLAIRGGTYADRLYGMSGDDEIFGDVGDDYLEGNGGADRIEGGTGSDILAGGLGDDALRGGEHDDVLIGGAGNDILEGGAGFDTYLVAQGADRITDSDGLGYVKDAQGRLIAGAFVKDGDGYAWIMDGTVTATHGSMLTLSFANGSSVAVENFSDDNFGIWLLDGPAAIIPAELALGTEDPDFLVGTVVSDEIQGLAGSDRIDGGDGNDALLGGEGRDFIRGGPGADLIQGGADSDILSGLAGDDRLGADAESDLDAALASDDALPGATRDWLRGGEGQDFLVGSTGADGLAGGRDADVLIGGAGDDLLLGDTQLDVTDLDWSYTATREERGIVAVVEPGVGMVGDWDSPSGAADVIYGGGGDDIAFGGAGDDFISGDGGADNLIGEEGGDILLGGPGNDALQGDADYLEVPLHGDDYLDGGDGNDYLRGFGGDDMLLGGEGADVLIGEAGADHLDGGAGDDELHGDGGAVASEEGSDHLDGGAGNDYLRGYGGGDELFGGEGVDVLLGEAGDDHLEGGADADELWAGEGADLLFGGDGADALYGDAGDDYLDGEAGDDILAGGGGNDLLAGGAGLDVLAGGEGDDTYYADAGDTILDDTGDNRVVLAAGMSPESLTLAQESDADGNDYLVISGGVGGVRVLGGLLGRLGSYTLSDGSEITHEQLMESAGFGPLFLSGSPAADRIAGTRDADTLRGGDGDDRITGNTGNDHLAGGEGDDLLAGGAGGDLLTGDAGADRLEGGEGDDFLFGGPGDDSLLGGEGADFLSGGAGADILEGGAGRDSYLLTIGMGRDGAIESGPEGNGIALASGIAFGNLAAERQGNDLFLGLRGTDDGLLLRGYYTVEQTWTVRDAAGEEMGLPALLEQLARQPQVPATIHDAAEGFVAGFRTAYHGELAASDYVQTAGNLVERTLTTPYGTYRDSASVDVVTQESDTPVIGRATPLDAYVNVQQETTVGFVNAQFGAGGAPAFWPSSWGVLWPDGSPVLAVLDYSRQDPSGRPTVVAVGSLAGAAASGGAIQQVSLTESRSHHQVNIERIIAGPSDNLIYAGLSFVDAGAGNDTIRVLENWGPNMPVAENFLYGNAGNDRIYGGAHWDILAGGAGDDYLQGQFGGDSYWVLPQESGTDIVNEVFDDAGSHSGFADDPGYFRDTVEFAPGAGPGDLSFSLGQVSHTPWWAPAPILYQTLDISWGESRGVRIVLPDASDGAGAGVEEIRFADGAAFLPKVGSDASDRFGDALDGTGGRDLIVGLDGHDWLNGLGGDDGLDGGAGDDLLIGAAGDDLLRGGPGADDLTGYQGHDLLFGEAGDDWVSDWETASYLDGGEGNDTLYADTDASFIVGGTGDDWIDSWAPHDVVAFNLGDGRDTVYVAQPFTISLGGGITAGDLSLRRDGGDLVLGTGADDSLRLTRSFDEDPESWPQITVQLMGEWVSAYDLRAAMERFKTLEASDPGIGQWALGDALPEFRVSVSTDYAIGGELAWQYATTGAVGALSDEAIRAVLRSSDFGRGTQPFSARSGNLILNGGAGDDILAAGEGNDTLAGGPGNDVLAGGVGDDTYVFNLGDGVDTITDTGGSDTLQFGPGISPEMLSLGLGSLAIRVGPGGDVVQIREFDPVNALADPVIERFTFVGGTVLSHGELVALGFDLPGTEGDDLITGTSLRDRMQGLGGNDTLEAGEGDDVLDGGPRDDLLAGGAGSDSYFLARGSGLDTIEDLDSAGTDMDRLRVAALPGEIEVTRDATHLTLALRGTGDAVHIRWGGGYGVEAAEFEDGTPWDAATLEDRVNDAPVLAQPIPVQRASEDAPFAFTVPAGTFSDADGWDTLAYSASSADGAALPAWLSFDPARGLFAGTPGNDDVGRYALKVTATDSAGASAAAAFALDVVNVNDAPVLAVPLPNQSAEQDQAWSWQLPAGAFLDVDSGDVLVFSASLSDGTPLPAWLAFDAAIRSFSGVPDDPLLPQALRVTATDREGARASEVFNLDVVPATVREARGGGRNDVLQGDIGRDRLSGLGGNDWLAGGGGQDFLEGGAGNDWLSGDAGRDLLDGGEGHDTLRGGEGRDLLLGGSGNDVLRGGEGADFLAGGTGHDTLELGAGDVVAFRRGDGHDTLFFDGSGPATLSLSGIAPADLRARRRGNDLEMTVADTKPRAFGWTGWLQAPLRPGTDGGGLVLKDWYAAAQAPVSRLEIVGATVEAYDFAGALARRDPAPRWWRPLDEWSLAGALLDAHLSSSSDESLGGELAGRYALGGGLGGVSVNAAQAVLADARFGVAAQSLAPSVGLQEGVLKLG